jgi:hypothetical protein
LLGQYLTDSDRLLQSFCAPVVFTRSGMHNFLSEVFNRPEYARDFLPHNLSHYSQFLYYGKSSGNRLSYGLASSRLFINKLKASPYLSAEALSVFLDKLPPLIEDYFVINNNHSWITELKTLFKQLLYKSFLNNFTLFKQDPDTFFDQLTEQMTSAIEPKSIINESIDKETFRNQIIRFLELALNKTIWTPFEYDNAWTSFKTLASQLVTLYERNIINYDELNDLSYSLMERFIYFLDLTGSELSLNVVETMKADIASGAIILCNIEEQEECLETKTVRLRNAIMETEAKILARKRGIITEILPIKT